MAAVVARGAIRVRAAASRGLARLRDAPSRAAGSSPRLPLGRRRVTCAGSKEDHPSKEARSHGIEEDITDPDARDAMIITQYQRMAHYAIAGYGCLEAFAKRLELKDDAQKLQKCLDATYHGDKTMTQIATGGINKAAA